MHSCSLCRSRQRPITAVSILLLLVHAGGCSQGPDRVAAPDWDPNGIAAAALDLLDKNGDASIDTEELRDAPGLAAGVRFVDQDGDGKVTAEELQARFEKYRQLKIGLRTQVIRVSYKGRPLANADVALIPEPFLKGAVEAAHGTTDANGEVFPQTDGQDLPGLQIGYYRVQVKSSGGIVPARYSGESSPLGVDVSLGEDASSYGSINLQLID